jgi:hypothetical protein
LLPFGRSGHTHSVPSYHEHRRPASQ